MESRVYCFYDYINCSWFENPFISNLDCNMSAKGEDYIVAKTTNHDSLIGVIVTHTWSVKFGIRADVLNTEAINNTSLQEISLSYDALGNSINATFGNGNNRKYAVMIIVNQACFSGTMMNHLY